MTCTKYGCDYELDLDGQVTCCEKCLYYWPTHKERQT